MRPLFVSLCALLWLNSACSPEPRCSGDLYFDPDNITCRPCPKNATFENGTCVCPSSYEFTANRCTLKDGAVSDVADAGGGGGPSPTCADYCGFAKGCLADNALANSVISDVVAGLNASDSAACESSCRQDSGGDGSSSPVVSCFAEGRLAAACDGDSTQTGLVAAFTLIGECCQPHTSDALCKSICKPLKANPLTSAMVSFCP